MAADGPVRRGLHDMVGLRRAGVVPEDAYVAVNLSAASLTDTSVLDDLVSWTQEAGLPAAQLVLEITETAIMQNTDVAVGLLRDLREHGVRVAMDDSGTGYSSLAYLRDLPISALKIDRSFVADITEQREALAIVAWIVDLARTVGVASSPRVSRPPSRWRSSEDPVAPPRRAGSGDRPSP
jgi:EAL domain-containing protein (putative c-di-GMP-specific phosphodiesterase class I)